MTTKERLEAVRRYVYEKVCVGRSMRTPGHDRTIDSVGFVEPRVYIGYYPTKPPPNTMPVDAAPSILIMFQDHKAKDTLEQRFDRYAGIKRPAELGAKLSLQFLFTVYEPQLRGIEFAQTRKVGALEEYTEDGLFEATTWADELQGWLMGDRMIPDSDLYVMEETLVMGPHSDQGFQADYRPYYNIVLYATFGCYTDRKPNETIQQLLRG